LPPVTHQIDATQKTTPIAAASRKGFMRSISSTSSNTIIRTAVPPTPASAAPHGYENQAPE